MKNDDKDLWRKRWLSCVHDLTSFDLQKTSWPDKMQTDPHGSFVEFMCSYFDDLGIDDNYKFPLDKGWLTSREFQTIKDWHDALKKYNAPNNEDFNHDAILKDPVWLGILQIGHTMKINLAASLNETERKILTDSVTI